MPGERPHLAGCCWGDALDRAALTARLRRQTALFHRWFSPGHRPAAFALACYEVAVRGGLDLALALLLWPPLVSDLLRPWLRRRLACAFLGFEDAVETRVACLLHPTRWSGEDRRQASAFRLLRGLGCGTPDYLCLPAHHFAHAAWPDRQRFRHTCADMDWYDFGRAAMKFAPSSEEERNAAV